MTERTLDVRERIVQATADLLAHGGRDAASTRAVSTAAGVQATTIYRQFGDMRGLLDAVTREAFASYMREESTRARDDDPIEDLRRGWDLHVAFGLANPAAYALIYGDPDTASVAPAARDAEAYVLRLVTRVAEAGRLRVRAPHAVRLLIAAGSGVTLALLASQPAERDARLSAAMREAVLAAITVAPSADAADAAATRASLGPLRVAARAVALRAVLADAPGVLSPAEQHLLGDWLDRLAGADGRGTSTPSTLTREERNASATDRR